MHLAATVNHVEHHSSEFFKIDRIAQDAIEASRGFTALASTANRTAYADLVNATSEVTGENATYQLVRQVSLEPAVAGTVAAQRRTLVVDVTWNDRNGQTQAVRLASAVTGAEPALAGSLVTAANPDPVLAPRGRHRAIPPSAVAVAGGSGGV